MAETSLSTKFVHAGERLSAPAGVPAATPIYASSSFVYERVEDIDRIVEGETSGFVYSRYGNPTVAAFESAMAELEGGSFAYAFGSGMAAIHASLLACELSPGSVILASKDLYGSTFELLQTVFGTFDVKTLTEDFNNIAALRAKAYEVRPSVMLCETLSNPLLKVCDIAEIAEIAQEISARLIVDNTFATPYLCRPLQHGADFVVHSATKYLGGHADATGGIVIGKEEFDKPALLGALTLAGGVLSPWEAHSLLRGIKTLGLRMERQCGNAERLATRLRSLPQISEVIYPKFFNSDQKGTLASTFGEQGFGAIITIRLLDDTREAAYGFLNSLNLCTRAASVGDLFTGIVHPATATHRELSPRKREEIGITEGLIRISVGIEDIEDIYADIEQALNTSICCRSGKFSSPVASPHFPAMNVF
ncbi:trans-sulfuration enzyme family protein [Leptolyngbya sp. 7M]|uniref:trans-sulfuration enzyme family protein n=1 Tax=Leptolyngbya sp. 7M TaxID=2812896 RepID=UPI001B8C5316|nr:PLP-dependent aspartate aminotransferase family protein [Leptolyngbya sp. 7M]QYO66800.1 PLP-dependent aspartate aminotransferase family protein [Leptolyngbya sp. 7M]